MTIAQLSKAGISRFRLPQWASPNCYARIDLVDGGCGPWFHLYDRPTQEAIGADTPQSVMGIGDTTDDYEPYDGPLDPEDKAV